MKYLRKFATEAEYQSAKKSEGFITPNISLIEETEKVEYNSYQADLSNPILTDNITFVALEDGLSVGFSLNPLEYCIDGSGAWDTLPVGERTPSINKGHTVSLRGGIETISETDGIGTFSLSCRCAVRGKLTSLIILTNAKPYQFTKLFRSCTTLVDASELIMHSSLNNYYYSSCFAYCTSLVSAPKVLPSTHLSQGCYSSLFFGCENLINASEIAATLYGINSCYAMYKNCVSLEVAPELNFAQINQNCCDYMFDGCSKLSKIKCIATTISPAPKYWVRGVASTGTFIKSANANWESGDNGIPTGWTVENI